MVCAFRSWAELGRRLRASDARRRPTWEGAKRLIAAAKTVWQANSNRLREILAESNKRLEPLQDPLLSDFGLPRWLADGREENYSDWLEWVVKQLRTSRDVLEVFGISQPERLGLERAIEPCTTRELCVRLPNWESSKRLDLVVRWPGQALLLVEVKKTSPEQADTAKQREYAEWAESQPEPYKYLVLLANEGERPEYQQFRLQPYGNLCRALRDKVPDQIKRGAMTISTGALVLAFVGAIEQNLLGLSADAARKASGRIAAVGAGDLVGYFDRFYGRRFEP